MEINLTPDLDFYVLSQVDSGRYADPSEVVRDALRHMQDDEIRRLAALSAFNSDDFSSVQSAIDTAVVELDQGFGTEHTGETELRRLFSDLRTEAQLELSADGKR